MQKKEFSTEIGGRTLTASFTDLADQASGSVILRYGDTTVLATAVMSENKREGIDFFPLVVDYEEKFYAAGEILGSRFMRREGRPSEEAILSGRIIDRTIRPLFQQYIRNEVQIVIMVLSLGDDDPDVLAINAASLALATSDIPWNGPVSSVRIGLSPAGEHGHNADLTLNNADKMKTDIDSFIVNPTYKERAGATLELTASGKDGAINMIEAGAAEVDENTVTQAFEKAVSEIELLQTFQKKIIKEIGKEKKILEEEKLSGETVTLFTEKIAPKLTNAVFSGNAGKESINTLRTEWIVLLKETYPDENISLAESYYEDRADEELHRGAVEKDLRADNRKMDEVRELFAQAGGVSSKLHGSGIFYRGGTHMFSALTLGGPRDALLLDGMEKKGEKRFMHHYNFPPFSAGETGRMGGTNRRMIGHGALAERALSYVIPKKEDFPYTIRIVSESMASNGSTSMASVCGSTLALMDAGVPISRPVAGIAMGLMLAPQASQTNADSTQTNAEKKLAYKILTDIQGPEDHHGDMDFKVAGTEKGITALQLDIKVGSIPIDILSEALMQAKTARLHILETITNEIPAPRSDISSSAPKIITMKVLEDQIGLIIGPSGKTINKMKEDTGVEEIQIEDDGTVYITGKNGTAERAQKEIEDMTRKYDVGDKFEGEVIKLFDFGALVKINAHTEGLVHISELAPFRIANVEDVVKEGDVIPVVVKEVGDRGIKFSLKDADPEYAKRKGVKPGETTPYQKSDNSRHNRRPPQRHT